MKSVIRISGAILLILLIHSCKKDKPTPPVLTTTSVTAITQTMGTSGGNITSDGGMTVLSRGVCWSTNNTPSIADNKTIDGAGAGSFVSSMTGLSTNTVYFVRAYATNASGTGYGMAMSFTTLPATTPALTTSDVTNITQNTASCGGNITSDGAASVTARGVCWSTTQNPIIVDSKTSDGSGIGSFTSNLTELIGNTTYYVRSYATNSAGTSYGIQTSFKTNPILPTILTAITFAISQTSAISGGNVTDDGGASVIKRGVCWSTSQNPTIEDNKSTDGIGNGIFSSTITGLTSNTTYYVRSYATNSVGTNYGSQVSFVTLQGGQIADIDGNIYSAVTIGTQIWMKENLRTTKYRNGDLIGTTAPATLNISEESNPKYQWAYDGSESNVATYGRLYTWYAATDSRNVCPLGWYVPTNAERYTLVNYLDANSSISNPESLIAGGKLKESGTSHWKSPNTGATNESGFTGLPGGWRQPGGIFYGILEYGNWWSSTEYGLFAYFLYLDYRYSDVNWNFYSKQMGFSIRCLKDN